MRPLPFRRVLMESPMENPDVVTLLDAELVGLAESDVLLEVDGGDATGWLEAEPLHDAHVEVGEVETGVYADGSLHLVGFACVGEGRIGFDLLVEHALELRSNLGKALFALHQVSEDGLQYVVGGLGRRAEKAEKFIDHQLVSVDFWALKHQA